MTKFKKNTHTHVSLSLYLSIRRCSLIFPKGCACTKLSLSPRLSLIHICKYRLDPDQTRKKVFFANLKIVLAIESTQSVAQMPMRTIRSQNIEFLSNTGPDPLKFSKLPSQHSKLGHHRHPSETPFKWRFAGGPMMARF